VEVLERKAERNAAIFAAWLDGKSFAEIGREHDITRQRAGQLVRIEARQLRGAVDDLREALNLLDNARPDYGDPTLKRMWAQARKRLRLKWGQ
jgi:hypothetical protein